MTSGGDIGVGVIGASSMIYHATIVDAVAATDGVRVVHEATRGGRGSDGIRVSSDYQAVLDDPEVDLVYVPLPNHLHEEWVVRAVKAGKHVLCEKPLGVDATAAERMAAAADASGVVLAEAYMSPFHPRTVAFQSAIRDGAIGRVLHGEARMSGVLPRDNHRWEVGNGGGALLDVGIYCLEPILTAMAWDGQAPVEVAASSRTAGDGVDEDTSAWLRFADGRTLSLWVSFAAADQQHLRLTGTDGTLEVDTRHATPDRRDRGYALRSLDGKVTHVETDTGDCYEGLVAHVRDVIRGDAELLRPPSRSVAVARVLDAIAVAAGHPRTTADG